MESSSGRNAARLAEVARELADASASSKELQEAIAAGDAVLKELAQVIASLKSASNWGVWDLLGGGLLAGLVKHSRLDDARSAAQRTPGHGHAHGADFRPAGGAADGGGSGGASMTRRSWQAHHRTAGRSHAGGSRVREAGVMGASLRPSLQS